LDAVGAAVLTGPDSALYALREAGKRMADALTLAIIADPAAVGRWMAFRLEDGRTDHVVYDTRPDAIRHQAHETLCHYEQLRPSGFSADECALTLMYARAAYDAGWRPSADDPAPIRPVRLEDARRKFRQLRQARR
jgi:hypothetical protein